MKIADGDYDEDDEDDEDESDEPGSGADHARGRPPR
jgi:hypothetical protein